MLLKCFCMIIQGNIPQEPSWSDMSDLSPPRPTNNYTENYNVTMLASGHQVNLASTIAFNARIRNRRSTPQLAIYAGQLQGLSVLHLSLAWTTRPTHPTLSSGQEREREGRLVSIILTDLHPYSRVHITHISKGC